MFLADIGNRKVRMYDNIYIDYKDAKCLIGPWNSWFVVFYLKRKIAKGDVSAQNYAFLADAYYARNDLKNAIKYARKAIWYDKNYAYGYYILGLVLRVKHGHWHKAKKYFAKALSLCGKDYYLAIYELICGASEVGDNIERDRYETMFLDIDCDNPIFLARKVYLHIGHWDFENAFKTYKQLWASYWKYKRVLDENFWRLSFYLIFENLVTIPCRSLLKSDMAEYLISVGKEEQALDILFELADNDKNLRNWSYRYLADYYWEHDEFKKCYDIANRMLIIRKTAYAYYYKAISSWKLREYDDGLKFLDKAENLDVKREFDNYDYWRCLMYCGLYDLHNALKYINQALLRNKCADNYKIKGDILVEMNKIKEANICYEQADNLRG